MNVRLLLYMAVLIVGVLPVHAQQKNQNGSVQGKIKDSKGEAIPLVSVYLSRPGMRETDLPGESGLKGAISDFNGFYRLENIPGEYQLNFSAVGYQSHAQTVTLKAGEILFLDVTLQSSEMELNEIIYSESRNPQRLEESTVSIALIKPSLIQNRNATSADLAIEQIPGVAVIDAEPQIRGGSGFSSGLGSRVLIMVDDMPLIRGDAGRPVWAFYPMENMDQIEVVKGAGSVLYGSGASNGVINIRTAFPKLKPETRVTVFAGTWNRPADSYKTPWEGFNPIKSGVNFYHSRIIAPKSEKVEVDFVIGGQALWNDGFRGGEPTKAPYPTTNPFFDSSRVNRGAYERSIRTNFNTRFRLKKVQGLTFGLNGNMIYFNEGQSFFWGDSDTNLYRMQFGSLTNFKNSMAYLDPYITYTAKNGSRHILRSRLFGSWSDGDVSSGPLDTLRLAQDSRSRSSFTEYQFYHDFSESKGVPFLTKNLRMTAGVVLNTIWSTGGVFANNGTGDSISTSLNAAAYLQLERTFFKRLTISGGARYEYFKLLDFEDARPVFRIGSNFRMADGTYLRGSIGQGFRFPTIGERFISVTSGESGFFANPNLQPEESWSAEFGFKQLFKVSKRLLGYLDFSGFWQEYKNFVEFAFENSNVTGQEKGFRFHNTGRARIRGVEAMLFTQVMIHKSWNAEITGGYTYSLPQSLEPDYVFGTFLRYDMDGVEIEDFPMTYASTISNPELLNDRILKYRIEHLVNADIQITSKYFSFGYTARYYSSMRQIDRFFTDSGNPAFAGLQGFLDRTGPGAWVFDARIAAHFSNYRLAFIVENLFNAEYSIRPLGIAPPRLTSLQFSVKF